MGNELSVRTGGFPSGKLFQEADDLVFRYSGTASPDQFVSLTMPVRRKDYIHPRLHPVFEMHLPEGYLLSIIKKQFAKITETDDFGLLRLLAPNVRGRVEYTRNEQSEKSPLQLDTLLHSDNPGLFEELVSRFALRSALSGVQPKVLAQLENKATLRLDDFIVKAWGPDYPALALNEYCCMLACQYAGIPVPEFYLSDDEALFIMKRFDLRDDGSALGFEDMCVLQAKQREDKYRGSYEQIAKTIKTFVSPENKQASLEQFFKMLVISNALQNGDAHLKNFGLVYESFTSARLAPAYDIVCTTAYIRQDIPALTLAGSKKWQTRKQLERFGVQACNLTASKASALYEECRQALGKLSPYIATRLTQNPNNVQSMVLEHLQTLIANETAT
ncbi:type II toxin-antitoxin system HipA family toxin [Marinobacter sp. 1_MG-2023]|uniref:type II toxin-antitoxin system HipA family toxin n=1 Tax=Marinobacter sp. 1_MG-2023 TaxID=3062627 RepID=UPI0026E151DA|nr:type II toxin-antitoxin system HipA family toxin [Marinobacter sp. 1_MG-2023]MDO6823329.1 type II toxin-antitoxin system HipA family toxin [Marinobacter sp. 1_MG-2023]